MKLFDGMEVSAEHQDGSAVILWKVLMDYFGQATFSITRNREETVLHCVCCRTFFKFIRQSITCSITLRLFILFSQFSALIASDFGFNLYNRLSCHGMPLFVAEE